MTSELKPHLFGAKTDFSIGQSLLQIDKLVNAAKAHGYASVAITDVNSIHAMADFTSKCKKAGIKPIIGATLKVYNDPTARKVKGVREAPNPWYGLKVYVLNEKGLAWLMRTLTRANSEARFYYNARCGLDDFRDAEGIAVSTGDFYNLFSHPEHDKILRILKACVGQDNLYIELPPVDTPLFDRTNALAIQAHERHGFRTLVTYPALCADAKEAASLDILNLIINNGRTNERFRPIQHVKDFNIQAPGSILTKVRDAVHRQIKWEGISNVKPFLEGIRNAQHLADSVQFVFEKMPVNLPQMAPDEFKALMAECAAGWKRRFAGPVLGHLPDFGNPDVLKAYKERLTYELQVLNRMGFSGYFLLAQQIVMWSKQNGILVGPGRGSVGGSLIAYLIGITDVDPLRFNLLFERFINPDRIDLPDADLDFMSSRRHEVIEYLTETYGQDRVAGISNYSTLASASAFRDTGRIYGLTPLDMQAIKLVPKEHGQPVKLAQASEKVPEIEMLADTYPEVWGHAQVFEGCMRSFGRHAAGVVVGRDPLVTRAVVERREGSPVISWDKRVVEDFGLVKLDILGLSTLDVLGIAKQYIQDRHGVEIDYLKIALEDPSVMEAFGRGDTTGVFQFESGGMRDLLKRMAKHEPLTFDDLAAATALYRPGPMDSGLLDDFVAIKQGSRLPTYEHPLMESALKDTYGVIVYQEQVMQVAVDLAGFTRTEADNLRKAMGKKDKDKMAQMRQQWVDGCKKVAGMDAAPAGALFDKIEAFAGYGFNKSHAVEYSVISYWTMFLRVKYAAEYFAACMSIVDSDKLPGLVKDARDCAIEVLPPDVNRSSSRYVIASDTEILAPFNSVLGISDTIANKIVELRENYGVPIYNEKGKVAGRNPPKGRFDSPEEFRDAAAQVGSKVNSRAVDRLELVGALAKITPGAKAPRHPDRRKDQVELMPGLIIDSVKADRYTDMNDGFIKPKIIHLVQDYGRCEACSLKNTPHPAIRIPKSKAKFMVVFDSPTWEDEKAGKLLSGEGGEIISAVMKESKLNVGEGYYTTLVKARKPKGEKFLSNEQLNGCRKYLEAEIELIKPAVIVALGSAAIRHFLPDSKGGASELSGKVVYDPKLQASIVCGFNPAQIGFDPSKVDALKKVFDQVFDVIS